ncbi:TonB family protein [Massilia sp. W12]|uniref:energy transducer TonB n=1 Tax=Massilia sp. W12 TaxID=3126507 RepID=UPI0030D443EF
MHFSTQAERPPLTRMLLVGVIHMSLLAAIVQGLSKRVIFKPASKPVDITIIKPADPPKSKDTPPLEPPKTKFTPLRIPPRLAIHPAPTEPTTLWVTDTPTQDGPLNPPSGATLAQEISQPPQKKTPLRTEARADAKDCAKPEYPAQALRNGEEGAVSLAFLIGKDNQVLEAKVLKSSGSRQLDKAAMAALSLCRFQAASLDGVAEMAWAKLDYVWKIE